MTERRRDGEVADHFSSYLHVTDRVTENWLCSRRYYLYFFSACPFEFIKVFPGFNP